MNYSQYLDFDTVNGSGIRCSLWVSGCTMACKGCFSPEAQCFDYGKPYTKDFEDKILEDLSKNHISGLSILGGHMYESQNIEVCTSLLQRVKSETSKNTTVWTGRTLDSILGHEKYAKSLQFVDTLIDGPFVESLKDTSLKWRGSSNQRILFKGTDF